MLKINKIEMIVCVCEWLYCASNAFLFALLFAGGRVLLAHFGTVLLQMLSAMVM